MWTLYTLFVITSIHISSFSHIFYLFLTPCTSNFGIFLANEVADENQKKKRNPSNKYKYDIDISSTLKVARKYFILRDCHKSVNIINLMMKYVHAVKTEFRQFARSLHGIGAIHFGYR
jgi:hypothetical protein